MTITDPDLGVIPTGQHHAAEPTPIFDEVAEALAAAAVKPKPKRRPKRAAATPEEGS